MKREIIIWPDPVLERVAEPIVIPKLWMGTVADDVRSLLNDMAETMEAARGAGLAAPQLGYSLRLVVVRVQILPSADSPQQAKTEEIVRLINPEIVDQRGTVLVREGCLSFPNIVTEVRRAKWVKVTALDEDGQRIEIEGDGKLAQALQHELEHLDGVTLANYLSPLKRKMTRSSLIKKKERGLRYVFDAPPPQDFTS